MPKSIHPREIPGIQADALELLEAAGCEDVALLAQLDPLALHQEMQQANAMLELADEDVPLEEVQRWLREAAEMIGRQADVEEATGADSGAPQGHETPQSEAVPLAAESAGAGAVDYEQSPEVQHLLTVAPFALPIPARVLMDHQVGVGQIPTGILLTHYVGDLEVRVNPNPAALPDASARGHAAQVVTGKRSPELDMSRLRTAEEAAAVSRPRSADPDVDSPHSLVRTPRSSTNKGKDPESRWYIRGVLHSNPVGLYLGALSTFLILWLVPASVISAVLLILSSELPDRFGWVPPQLLAVPVLLLVAALLYLFYGVGGRCRVCNQRLFVYHSHHRSGSAHFLPGLGYILPLCLHLLVFRWFRCTHCGTPIRVKE